MRKYTFVYTDGKERVFEAEQDSLHPGGAVVLSKEVKISILSDAKKLEIVRVISLHNVLDYGYVELPKLDA